MLYFQDVRCISTRRGKRTVDGSAETIVRHVVIRNRDGFHSRPVMRFVDLAQRFDSRIEVVSLNNEQEVVDGKSAMELMLLGATQGTELRLHATGADAQEALDALAELIHSEFHIKYDGDKSRGGAV